MAQYDDYMRDFSLVKTGQKPVVIIERRKSPKAYLTVLSELAPGRRSNMHFVEFNLADSSGAKLPAILVGDIKVVCRILSLLQFRSTYTRGQFQFRLGGLLGYSVDDICDFIRSSLSLTCGCELCGGPTIESRADDVQTARRLGRFVG